MKRGWNVENSGQRLAISNQLKAFKRSASRFSAPLVGLSLRLVRRFNVREHLERRLLYIALSACVLAACTAAPTPTAESLIPAAQPKLLATVFISPTPDSLQQAATRGASTATPTVLPVSDTPQATPYIGVFLGEANPDAGEPNYDVTLASPLSLPTLDAPAAACSIPPDESYGTGWTAAPNVTTNLGCPIEAAASFDGTMQIFERGVMYFRPTGEIWAVAPGAARYWYVTAAPPVEVGEIIAPEGLRAPVLGFGAVWRGVEGVEAALGFARTGEEAAQITLQRFQGGSLLRDRASGQVFILYADGTLSGPYS